MTSRASRSTQARGRLRREALRSAALACLEEIPLEHLTLGIVAERADVPKASAYNFYANIDDLFAELITLLGQELADSMSLPGDSEFASWQDLVTRLVLKGVNVLNASPAGRHLVLGPKVPPDLKWRDRRNDMRLGILLREQIEQFFHLPDFPERDRCFYHAIELSDLLFCLSVAEHGFVTEEMKLEGAKAACAYLGIYLPPRLKSRPMAARAAPEIG